MNLLCITPWARNALQLLADGHTTDELSRHLGGTASEIDSLLEELFAAMGVATQAEAIAAAHKRGLFKEASATHRHDTRQHHSLPLATGSSNAAAPHASTRLGLSHGGERRDAAFAGSRPAASKR